MATLGLAVPVDGPVPAPPVYTLVGAALTGDIANGHWEGGVAVRPYPCGPGEVWDPCSTGTGRPKLGAVTSLAPLADYNPFVVVKGIGCTTRQGLRDHPTRVKTAFAALRHWSIEREFWQGDRIPANPHLAQASATTIATGVGPVTAMAYLEEAIGDTSQQGMIHAPRILASQWIKDGTVRDVSGKLRSPMGNVVVPGGGYSNTGPTGADPNGTATAITSTWAYATTPVVVYGSEIYMTPDEESEAVDRLNNTIVYRAEQTVAVIWDRCLHVAVQVTLTPST